MDNQQNNPVNPQETQNEPQFKWVITDEQLRHLHEIRNHLIHQRAYQVLTMSQDTMFDAAQASGYDLGRIKMLDELLDTARIVRID